MTLKVGSPSKECKNYLELWTSTFEKKLNFGFLSLKLQVINDNARELYKIVKIGFLVRLKNYKLNCDIISIEY